MSKSLVYRWVIGVFLALFIGLQSYSIAHASEHIDASHQNDCISCDVTVLADSEVVVTPSSPAIDVIVSEILETTYPNFTPSPASARSPHPKLTDPHSPYFMRLSAFC